MENSATPYQDWHVRLECLQLAVKNSAGDTSQEVVTAAQQYFDFVQSADAKPAAG